VAKRTTRERVDLARKANASPAPLSIAEAQRYPFFIRQEPLDALHARAGLSFRVPDPAWIAAPVDAETGRVLCFEKVALFAGPLRAARRRRARARLALGREGLPRARRVA
jgi:hypothetical protein